MDGVDGPSSFVKGHALVFPQNRSPLTDIPDANTTGSHKIKPRVMGTCSEMFCVHPCFAREELMYGYTELPFSILFCHLSSKGHFRT